jgi:hypothetical protein
MLLDVGREVTTNITIGKTFTTTENSSKLFAMLSNMLYKDKERSVLTELSSNALDAHKMVGKENVPIEVTLPTSLVQELRIRDFGPGLSEEQIYKFLTTYGESSKQNSNDFIGGFGIGSKSPAAVTDTWTIHSMHDGLHKQYLVFVSAEGVPTLTKIMEKPTTETGLEVVVPTKKDRISAWHDAACHAYMTYEVHPNVKTPGFKIPVIEWRLNTKWIATSATYYVQNFGSSALINNRLYSISTSKIEGLSDIHAALLNIGAVFKFNIGELNLNLSREDLQYDTKTMNAIKARIKDAYDELQGLWKTNVVDKATDELEYYVFASETLNNWFPSTYSKNTYNTQLLYEHLSDGNKMYNRDFKLQTNSITLTLPREYCFKIMNTSNGKIFSRNTRSYRYDSLRAFGVFSGSTTSSLTIRVTNLKEAVFIENDVPSSWVSRVRERYVGTNKHVLITDDFSFLPNFLKAQVVKASSLPKPAIKRSKKSDVSQSASPYYCINGNRFVREEESVFKAASKVAYVFFTNSNTIKSILPEYVDYVHRCENYGISIVGLKEGTPIPAWAQSPKDALLLEYENMLKNYDELCASLFTYEIRQVFGYEKTVTIKNIKRTTKPSLWNDLLDTIENFDHVSLLYLHNINKLNKIKSLASCLNEQPPVNKYEILLDNFYKTYPMLSIIFRNAGHFNLTVNNNIDIVVEYCEQMENKMEIS